MISSNKGVRVALPEDAAALSALALAAKAHWGYSNADLARWQTDLQVSPELIRASPCWVIDKDGEPAGYCRIDALRPPSELIDLFVHPRWLRSGLGKALLQVAAREVLHLGGDRIRVDADPNAEVFYLRMGGRRIAAIAAPAENQPHRVRPQMLFDQSTLQGLAAQAVDQRSM